jgi:mono/diheme cytochrome c family protein
MPLNVLICLALVAIAALFVWLTRRALRLRNPAARWALTLFAALFALLFVLVVGLVGYGYAKLYLPRSAPALALDTAVTPDRVERGAHLARTTCVACHSTNGQLPLSGGNDLSGGFARPDWHDRAAQPDAGGAAPGVDRHRDRPGHPQRPA